MRCAPAIDGCPGSVVQIWIGGWREWARITRPDCTRDDFHRRSTHCDFSVRPGGQCDAFPWGAGYAHSWRGDAIHRHQDGACSSRFDEGDFSRLLANLPAIPSLRGHQLADV